MQSEADMQSVQEYKEGIKHGIPIFTGYLAVSFAFGIAASEKGLNVIQAVFMSLTNVTSAGQFASLDSIKNQVSLFELAFLQFIINIRYLLMSTALTQKLGKEVGILHRCLIAYGVTDEIFALSVLRHGKLKPSYSYGLITISVSGWILGTFLGASAGKILPAIVISCLGLAIYGMFIAIIIPPAKESRAVLGTVLGAMGMSFFMTYAPIVSRLSSGFRIIIITVVVSMIAATVAPRLEGDEK